VQIWGAKMDFVAIDVETANWDQSSICQIGYTVVKDGQCIKSAAELIDPETFFDEENIAIHGITESDVRGAPTFAQVWPSIIAQAGAAPIISHGPFDRIAIGKALAGGGLTAPENQWIDTIRLSRRVWPEHFRNSGYGLKSVCATLGIPLDQHHDAGHDALAAAHIMLHAHTDTNLPLAELAALAQRKMRQPTPDFDAITEAALDGPLANEVIVFTGALSLTRTEAQTLAAQLGATVGGGVTKKTSILVIGDLPPPYEKSVKHKKAAEHIARGQAIKVLTEDDFMTLAKESNITELA
jgi:DNA polymerase-3 subunit epsilon